MRDLHGEYDYRNIEVSSIGICDLKMPFCFVDNSEINTVANIKAGVLLNSTQRGAHLSRITEVLNSEIYLKKVNLSALPKIVKKLSDRCESTGAYLELRFPFFVDKNTPNSGMKSHEEAEIIVKTELNERVHIFIEIIRYGMMVCPCSKEISKYGAHSQKCRLNAVFSEIRSDKFILEELINIIDNQFSSAVYSLVKRSDEQFMTESSYENAKFSEDLVRDCLIELNKLNVALKVKVKITNLESIHKHNVFACGEI